MVVGRGEGGEDGIARLTRASRRSVLRLVAGAAAGAVAGRVGFTATPSAQAAERHGISAFGELKYPPDFRHFDYVDPGAPKGGIFSQIGSTFQYNQNPSTFNSLNSFIFKGVAALGMEMTFASLMARAFDERDAMYGQAARAVRISDDGLAYQFLLRPGATFHDGSKLTAHDVAFSLNILKEKGHPQIRQYLRQMLAAEAAGDLTVTVRFEPGRARDVPLFAAGLPIFARAYYARQPFDESTLEIPLGSGPYKVARFEANRYIEYERVKDWWGAGLPTSRGRFNFDRIRYEFFRDRNVAFEGFKARTYLFREEFTSATWATRYDFPAFTDGRVRRAVLPDENPSGAQGWFINTRREKFKDPRFREALICAFDFEWTNKSIMYGSYLRTHSVFQNSDLMADGKPGPDELALLEPFRGKVPDEVFGAPFVPPVSDGSGRDRALLRRAVGLIRAAGFTLKDGKLFTPQGERVTIEFFLEEPSFQPHHQVYIKNLIDLGIDATLRFVDPAQGQARVNDFDFDLVVKRYGFSTTPGDSLRAYFSSQGAAIKGSHNLAGIADPVVDTLIETIAAAPDRAALVTACRALDRVLRAGRYWVPHWYKPSHWIAYWDTFGRPPHKPRYARGIPDTWWYDSDKAAQLDRRG